MLAVSEQDSYLVKKDSDETKLDSSNDAGFFDQLALANQASETHSTQAKAPNKQSADEQYDLKEQSREEKPLSGEDMLAQINAAQVIDTSVKNNPHGGAQLIDKDAVKINAKPEDKLAPIITMPSDAVVDDEIIPQTQNVQGANLAGKGEGEPTLLDTKALAAVNASQKGDVGSSQLATDKVADKPTETTHVKSLIL